MSKHRELSNWIGEKVKIEFKNINPNKDNVQVETTLEGVDSYGVFTPGVDYELEFYPFSEIRLIMKGKK